MGIFNAIFAPFIVVYLLMYSFFRYFEVSLRPCFDADAVRNTTRIHRPSEADSTLPMRSGNFASSTSYPICLSEDWTEAIPLPRNTLINFQMSVQHLS